MIDAIVHKLVPRNLKQIQPFVLWKEGIDNKIQRPLLSFRLMRIRCEAPGPQCKYPIVG